MRILGIDPGYAIVGYGIVDFCRHKFSVVDYGSITTSSKTNFSKRLKEIYDDLSFVIEKYKPEYMAVEKLFFQNNQKTAIDVSQARGIILLCAENFGVNIAEYTPLQVKLSTVVYGNAEKFQVQEMTKNILKLNEIPKPDDTADALAIAVTHAHSYNSQLSNY